MTVVADVESQTILAEDAMGTGNDGIEGDVWERWYSCEVIPVKFYWLRDVGVMKQSLNPLEGRGSYKLERINLFLR